MQLCEAALTSLETRGYVTQLDDGRLRVSLSGNPYITFLCHLFWPFVESYWVAALCVVGLVPAGSVTKKQLLGYVSLCFFHFDCSHLLFFQSRMSWLAEQLYNDGKLPFFEACSLDVLGNAFDAYVEHGSDFFVFWQL